MLVSAWHRIGSSDFEWFAAPFHRCSCGRSSRWVDAKNHIEWSPEHVQKVLGYPDPDHYLNHVQKYFFRGKELAHLRPGQFFRYIVHNDEQDASHKAAMETKEDVEEAEEQHWGGEDNVTHRHYDSIASGMET